VADGSNPVSVLMSVHNEDDFLVRAIDSILNQTFRNFEFIIIDDGSTNERTQAILRSIRDERVLLVRNEKNIGLTRCLNRGLELAHRKYVARMDADDVSDPKRLECQLRFMEAHPDVGILGASARVIDHAGREGHAERMPTSDLCIRWACLTSNPFSHSTVMLRKDVLERCRLKYDESFVAGQDYDLWTRALEQTKGANLDRILLSQRIHEKSVSVALSDVQEASYMQIASRTISRNLPGFQISREGLTMFNRISRRNFRWSVADGENRRDLVLHLLSMLEVFVSTNRGHEDITQVRRYAMWRLARTFMLKTPVCGGWGRVLKKAISMDPFLPMSMMLAILASARRRIFQL
jgi:glycosyltransferase involved in cell wall biosynthesis